MLLEIKGNIFNTKYIKWIRKLNLKYGENDKHYYIEVLTEDETFQYYYEKEKERNDVMAYLIKRITPTEWMLTDNYVKGKSNDSTS